MAGILKFTEVGSGSAERLREAIETLPELSQGYSILNIRASVAMMKDGVPKEEAERALREQDGALAQLERGHFSETPHSNYRHK